MRISSTLSPKEYIYAIKAQMSGHMEFGIERFTGFFLGRLFYVTYHSGYEWNRRITNQKNAAIGYIRRTENGSEIRFLRFRGALCPLVFIPLYLPILAVLLFMGSQRIFSADEFLFAMVAYHIMISISVLISTFVECMTERSEDGRKTLLSMLLDPTDYLANYHKL